MGLLSWYRQTKIRSSSKVGMTLKGREKYETSLSANRVLEALSSGEKTINQVAEDTEIDIFDLKRIVDKLERHGLIRTFTIN